MSDNEEENRICGRCRKFLAPEAFKLKKRGQDMTRCRVCIACNERLVARARGNKCPHNKRAYVCKECNGAGVCSHGKVRGQCIACGGSRVCEHLKMRYSCVECKGGGICIHDHIKTTCIPCGGSAVCIEHQRLKFRCIDCRLMREGELRRAAKLAREKRDELNPPETLDAIILRLESMGL